jgi:hypothetical protein
MAFAGERMAAVGFKVRLPTSQNILVDTEVASCLGNFVPLFGYQFYSFGFELFRVNYYRLKAVALKSAASRLKVIIRSEIIILRL